jgi:cobalamin biosynthesis protein CobC
MPEHGGNLDVAIRRFGGRVDEWIDLSTGINRQPYPVGELPPRSWSALPSRSDIEALHDAAREAYGTTAPLLAVAGAQAAIQLLPRLVPPGMARILAPTYNEYAPILKTALWQVEEVSELGALSGASLAIVVNPNNPDGRQHDPQELLALSTRVGRLVVDESFVDAVPAISLASAAGKSGLLVLRSFGKFYGLAGLRLGFVLGCEADVARLSAMIGPWPVSGAAIEVGRHALSDRTWAEATRIRLGHDALQLDELAKRLGWSTIGGTPLFRLYETGDAVAAQDRLVKAKIWSRIFSGKPGWLRLGLPGDEAEWARVAAALSAR